MHSTTNLTANPSADTLILGDLLADDDLWQIHNCKFSQIRADFDKPLPLLAQYDGLDETIKGQYPLSFEQLKQMHTPMSIQQASDFLGIEERYFARFWQVKYIGRVVIFCERLQVALRFYFSNTSKPYQALTATDAHDALDKQSDEWRSFGVVDIVNKGAPLLCIDGDDMPFMIEFTTAYQALPSTHSVAITAFINNNKRQFDFVGNAIKEHLSKNAPNF